MVKPPFFSELIPLFFLVEPQFCLVKLPCFHASQIALGRGSKAWAFCGSTLRSCYVFCQMWRQSQDGWMEGYHPYMGFQSREILLYTVVINIFIVIYNIL